MIEYKHIKSENKFNQLQKSIMFFTLLILLSSCSTGIKFSSISNSYPFMNNENIDKSNNEMIGEASYYADKFVGRKTASGKIYNHSEFTAAHRTLPFGSKVRVYNTRNGKEVTVTINDRGPFVEGRVIDLSKEAAKTIGILSSGTTEVILEVLE